MIETKKEDRVDPYAWEFPSVLDQRSEDAKKSQAPKPADKLPPFKLTPPNPGDPPGVYTREQAAADWKMVEARLEARGITSGF